MTVFDSCVIIFHMGKKKKKRYVVKAPVQFLAVIGIVVLLALGAVIWLLSCTCGATRVEPEAEATPSPSPTCRTGISTFSR